MLRSSDDSMSETSVGAQWAQRRRAPVARPFPLSPRVEISGPLLVPQRGRDLAVAKPLLEVGEGRTRTGRPRRAGVPEVGHPQVRSPAASRGIRKFRWSVDACTCDTPSRPGKCNASGHTAVIASRWCAIAGTTCGGTDTTLVPRRRLSGSPRWPGHRPMTPHGRPSPSRPRCPRPCDAARSPPH